MQLPLNVRVSCTDGEGGMSTRVVVDPTARRATHLVVRERHRPHDERLVPVDVVRTATSGEIQLSCSTDDLSVCRVFDQEAFLDLQAEAVEMPLEEPDILDVGPTGWTLWPYVYPHIVHMRRDHPRIPKQDVAVRRGAVVEARDGRVGKVKAFVVDPNDDQITDLVIDAGHLLGRHDAVLPLTMVDSWDEDSVHLSVNRSTIAALPHVPLRKAGEPADAPVGDEGLEPEPADAAGKPVQEQDTAHVEGARLLADQAEDRLRARGFSDEEIREWTEAFIRAEGSGGVDDFVAWIGRQERRPTGGTQA